jgi:hypothetical protein
MSDVEARTWWNGEPAEAVRCKLTVGRAPVDTWWCADLEGQERDAVIVSYGDEVFFLDNEDGSGWAKVTDGRGSPLRLHRSLPSSSRYVFESAHPDDLVW